MSGEEQVKEATEVKEAKEANESDPQALIGTAANLLEKAKEAANLLEKAKDIKNMFGGDQAKEGKESNESDPGTDTDSFLEKAKDEIGPIFSTVMHVLFVIYETSTSIWKKAKPYIENLPTNAVKATYGISLCFFGGMFGNAIAATEAFAAGGGENFKAAIVELHEQIEKVYENVYVPLTDETQVKDDLNEELRRKALLFVREVDPKKLMHALGSVYTAVISMLMVLKFKFAKTLALANSIAKSVTEPAAKFILSKAKEHTENDVVHEWLETGLSLVVKGVVLAVSTAMIGVLGAVQSAVKGGTIFGNAVVAEARSRGLLEKDSNSNVNHFIGWSVAAVGVYFQVFNLFSVPFPFNIILFPLSFIEYGLTAVLAWMS